MSRRFRKGTAQYTDEVSADLVDELTEEFVTIVSEAMDDVMDSAVAKLREYYIPGNALVEAESIRDAAWEQFLFNIERYIDW